MKNTIAKSLIVFAALLPFIWLSLLSSSPSGERSVSWIPGSLSPFVQSPLPAERVSGAQDSDRGAYVSIESEPVYFSVFPPSDDFTSAEVSLEFDPHDAFAVELGGMTNLAAYAFDFRALSNAKLENLSWNILPNADSESALTVFAKDDVKAAVQDFVLHQPARTAVVTYRATLPGTYREPSYTPLGHEQTFSISLRGSHEYVTYIKNELFHLALRYQDINRTFGADEGYVRVYDESGTVMLERTITDDGNISEDQTYSSHDLVLDGKNWPEGVYRVELSGTSDIMWRQFITNQRYMAFKNRLYVGDDVGYLSTDRKTSFTTNSKSIAFETFHADSAHLVTLGASTVGIPQSHVLTRATIPDNGTVTGITDAGDIKMTGEGKFAPVASAFFDPDPRPLTTQTNLEDPTIRYVYANLSEANVNADGWRVADTTFSLTDLAKEAGAYKFALSLPGLATDAQSVDVHRFTVTFHKEPISIFAAIKLELRRWRDAVYDRLF
ncbi:MAG: hypothetical protein AAB473_02035 [Patescibacteria group bacterium]